MPKKPLNLRFLDKRVLEKQNSFKKPSKNQKIKFIDPRFIDIRPIEFIKTISPKEALQLSQLITLAKQKNQNLSLSSFFTEMLKLKEKRQAVTSQKQKQIIDSEIKKRLFSKINSLENNLTEKQVLKKKKIKLIKPKVISNQKDINYYLNKSKLSPEIKKRILSIYNKEENKGLRERFNLIVDICENKYKSDVGTINIFNSIKQIINEKKTKNPFSVFYYHLSPFLNK
jgi:hypothetical protein